MHFTELRTALDAPHAAIGLTAIAYTDPTLSAGVVANGAHMTEVCDTRVTPPDPQVRKI